MNKAKPYIGTSGYSYPHWRDVFYPKDVRENKWLEHYAKFFDTVELNVTFYRLPRESAFLNWRKRTPKNFKFSVKGSRFITHVKKFKNCGKPLKLFFSRVKLLKEKLGGVLWQLPASFKADPKRLGTFLKCLRKYKDIRHVFEFRNETWHKKEIFDMLKTENLVLCRADWPLFGGDVYPIRKESFDPSTRLRQAQPRSLRLCSGQAGFRPPGGKNGAPGLPGGLRKVRIAADFIYLRRHGQGATLYGGCYSNRQLKEDAKIIKKNLNEKKDVYIYFNNDTDGYAVKNALTLKAMFSNGD